MFYDMSRLTPSGAYRLPNAPVAVQLGLGAEQVVPKIEIPAAKAAFFPKFDPKRFTFPIGKQRGGGAVQATPFGGAVAKTPTGDTTPVGTTPPTILPPTVPTVPDTAAARVAPSMQQQQTQWVQQSVSVPVQVAASPTTSITIAPPQPQDYGPMVPGGVAAGMGQFLTNKCIAFAIIGGLVAYLMKKR